ncbi:hypothetical protein PHSY_005162 [Pseudozyma hubeiensis SY62]|uniref:Uncharacterized protein n=1 Tax=Pseudozyma hubeiensis (strain SY62) TaxID=1305764 RepID=R9P880_PSEHS|nr:hypothetical protein PHSY_005162 [Pseudozyma hubeiensis SY62]GAC97576.1 hypothetical protein PHSY_005162 [Pseudozyma hubeiensis SY62]
MQEPPASQDDTLPRPPRSSMQIEFNAAFPTPKALNRSTRSVVQYTDLQNQNTKRWLACCAVTIPATAFYLADPRSTNWTFGMECM